MKEGSPGTSVIKNPPANAGDARDQGSILGLGRSPGVGNSNPLQYSYLENSIDWVLRSPWGLKESDTIKHTHTHTHTHTHNLWQRRQGYTMWKRLPLQ